MTPTPDTTVRICKICGCPGPYYERKRRMRDGTTRVEAPRLCKICERKAQRDRYHAKRKRTR